MRQNTASDWPNRRPRRRPFSNGGRAHYFAVRPHQPDQVEARDRQFQIVQQGFDRYQLRYVSERPASAETEAWILGKFCESLDTRVVVAFEQVPEIARTRAGKFMPARSELFDGAKSGGATRLRHQRKLGLE